MRLKAFILGLLLLGSSCILGQEIKIYNDNIKSVQVVANHDWESLPIIELNNGKIAIDFDDLTHSYRRLTYSITHCEANWEESKDLFDSDYITGFASGNNIEDVKESVLTTVPYLHYHFELPNEQCTPTISGNYKLSVWDSNQNDKPLFVAYFMILEPRDHTMGVSIKVKDDTDATIRNEHQQVDMDVNYGNYTITNPQQQIKTVVLQNRQWFDKRENIPAQYVLNTGLQWRHCKDYIFDASNEYRKFEILSDDVASMGIDHISWDGKLYNAYPFTAKPLQNYLYDKDADGAFLIRNSDNVDINTTSDYIMVHFRLDAPVPFTSPVYIDGDFTYHQFKAPYLMTYYPQEQCYKANMLLKLGYYNYQYLQVPSDKNNSGIGNKYKSVDANHYQTENSYQALVYYRPNGARTDQLVGYTQAKYKNAIGF